MQAAVPVGVGAMAALLGLNFEAASEVAAEAAGAEVCQAANDNDPGQVVVSGNTAAVERAVEIAKSKGAKRAIILPVSAPFHCPLMAPAGEAMALALANVDIRPPLVPVYANVSARPVHEPNEIRDLLKRQVTSMVRWRECVAAMAGEGVELLVEAGAGNVLKSLTRRIDPKLGAVAVGGVEDVKNFLKSL